MGHIDKTVLVPTPIVLGPAFPMTANVSLSPALRYKTMEPENLSTSGTLLLQSQGLQFNVCIADEATGTGTFT